MALVFRDWLPSVIQEIDPYVSSEDIDKGARWSTDIAKELSDSTFGILCVTRENISAPWLTFEAGALSKTMDKAFVSPFLFDIKRSEVDGPILQFQSTISEKDDLKKLVTTLNKACEKDSLSEERLNKAFDVWYPTLYDELEKLRDAKDLDDEDEEKGALHTPRTQEILEEILELTRINQKLIRNPDSALGSNLEDLSNMIRMLVDRSEKYGDSIRMHRSRKFHPMMFDELMHMRLSEKGDDLIGAQMALGLVRSELPWVYDAGMETINILRTKKARGEKQQALKQFGRIMEFSFEHPMMREMNSESDELHSIYRRLPDMLNDVFEKSLNG
ncbi:MAG: hypothetical protein GY761_11725 [Hyphomicrobiales bacterium]|nr:hypothetical protein [Hyphomicrobiales bacterium]